MNRPVLVLIVTREAGGLCLRAPAVGVWSSQPASGTLVGPGSGAGRLVRLGRSIDLLIPDGVAGRVATAERRDHAVPVAYGEILIRVEPIDRAAVDLGATGASAVGGPETALYVTAPTDGVFYRSPTPGAKAYVAAGDRLTVGQSVGLIEVMKTFNPIVYGGTGLPEAASVVELLAADGEEVRAGQPLVAVR